MRAGGLGDVLGDSPPIRRMVVNRAPTGNGADWSVSTRITSDCHSANRVGSVATVKTSSGGRAMSRVVTMGSMGCASFGYVGRGDLVMGMTATTEGR
jgi:hypothetical protein